MKLVTNKTIVIVAFVSLLAGCAIQGNYQRSATSLPTAFTSVSGWKGTQVDTSSLIQWWDVYQDTALKLLIRQALDSNRNLLAAATRVEQARLLAENARVALYPSVGYSAQVGAGQVGVDAQRAAAGINGGVYKTFGTVSWEPDIWGRLKNGSKAAVQDLLSTDYTRQALATSIVAEVAANYFLLRDLDNRLDIARLTLVGRKESTRINAERFAKGYAPELDQLQAQQQELFAAAVIPSFKRQIYQVENALALLTGKVLTDSIRRGIAHMEQQLVPTIPVGLPSQLLLRRPDVKAAEASFQATLARLGIAKASLYPSITLTGLLGFASPQLATLISGDGFAAIGLASLVGPIFANGQNKRRVAIQSQKVKEAVYQYEQTLLNAFREVNVAINQYHTAGEEYQLRQQQAIAARKALVLSKARYEYGYTSYLEVLIQETNLLDAELQASATFQLQLNAVVNLYRSLGGGW